MKTHLIIISVLMLPGVAMLIDKFFMKKNPFFCHFLGWHSNVIKTGYDGCSNVGVCQRCNHRVLQDSQGNWF